MPNYVRHIKPNQTPQSQPILGSNQVPNSAGGYSFAVDDWTRLDRFLILGSEGGSYYATERKLTAENANAILRCIEMDGERTVQTIVRISDEGRAPKNDPALFALALCTAYGNTPTKKAAFAALPHVARTGTHLFHFALYANELRGWGRGLRQSIADWYNRLPARDLAYQLVKYQQRDGWSHRDLLRLSHALPTDDTHNALFHWATQGWPGVGDEPHPDEALRFIWAFERAKRAGTKEEILSLIRDYRLPREAIPTEWLNDADVWKMLLPEMPMTAMIRNLATMTRIGLLAPNTDETARIVAELRDQTRLKKARIHPIAILGALLTYKQGHGVRGSTTWKPVTPIVDALDEAFYLAFGNVTPTNKHLVLALDVSGSMAGPPIAGVPGLTARVGSAAMALITAATESRYTIMGFSHELVPLSISPRQRLDDVVREINNIPMGATDCALPMLWALGYQPRSTKGQYVYHPRDQVYEKVTDKVVNADAFVVYTDSETYFGDIHPKEALQRYRQETGIPAKMVVVGMVANNFSIADSSDAGMFDVVGFDTAAPQLMSDFIREGIE